MPRQETVLQVFVASPGDLAEERGALEEVIRELNSTWSGHFRCRLELVRWETHAVPGFSEDAQQVVNETVPQDYDIFIGLLWSQFGTPTGRADSGTEEEFNIAFERHTANPESLDLMFYFKDKAVPPSQLDPDQLAKIQSFRHRLKELGALRGEFESVEEFQNLVRVHLSRLVQKWMPQERDQSSAPAETAEPPATVEAVASSDSEVDAEGLLDFLDDANDAIEKLTELAERMTATITELGGKFDQRTAEVEALAPETGSYDVKAAKRITAKMAADLDEYVARTEVDIPIFAEAISTAMGSFGRAASLSLEFESDEPQDLAEVRSQIAGLRETLVESRSGLATMREALASTPRMTSVLNKAKRRALQTMDSLLRVFGVGASQVAELESTLEEIDR